MDVRDGAEERRRGDDADARNREEALGDGIGRGNARQLAIDVLDASFQGAHLVVDERQRLAQVPGQSIVRAVRVCCHCVRTRWSACNACCSGVFTGTG